jgi:tetratricopeptide (TPR) repeat protein
MFATQVTADDQISATESDDSSLAFSDDPSCERFAAPASSLAEPARRGDSRNGGFEKVQEPPSQTSSSLDSSETPVAENASSSKRVSLNELVTVCYLSDSGELSPTTVLEPIKESFDEDLSDKATPPSPKRFYSEKSPSLENITSESEPEPNIHLRRSPSLDEGLRLKRRTQRSRPPRHPRLGYRETGNFSLLAVRWSSLRNKFFDRLELISNDLEELQLDLDISEAQHGPKNPRVGLTWIYIGAYYQRSGDYSQAKEAYFNAAECSKGRHPGIEKTYIGARAFACLGSLHFMLGEFPRAVQCFEMAKDGFICNEEEHGREAYASQDVADCLVQLSLAYAANKDYDNALNCLIFCRQILQELQTSPVLIGKILDAMGYVHYCRGCMDDAKRCHEDALFLKLSEVGPQDLLLVPSYLHLSTVYRAQGDLRRGIKALYKAHKIQEFAWQSSEASGHLSEADRALLLIEWAETWIGLSDFSILSGDQKNYLCAIARARGIYMEAGLTHADTRVASLTAALRRNGSL